MNRSGDYHNEIDPYAVHSLSCAGCRKIKPQDAFAIDLSRSRGRRYSCRECAAKKAADRYREDPIKHRLIVKRSYEKNICRALISAARKRAMKKGMAFDLDKHREKIKNRLESGSCELTGIEFVIGKGHHWASPSIDRIDLVSGYVYENIRIIIWGYNSAMGKWGEEVLFFMVDARRSGL